MYVFSKNSLTKRVFLLFLEESWIFYIRFDFLIRMTETDRIYTVDQLMTPYGTIDDVTNGIIAVTIRNGVILRDWSWFHVISRYFTWYVWQWVIDYIRSSRDHN